MEKVLFATFVLFWTACSNQHKNINDFPSFNILLPDSLTIVNTCKAWKEKPTVLVYFSPDCEHCQKETASILHNMDSLKNVQFFFITNDPLNRLIVFNWYYKIYRYSNITLGRDYSFFFPGHYKDVSPPYTMIFDQYKHLAAVYKGESEARDIIHCISTF